MSPETSGFFSRVLSSACFVGPVWALAIEATVVHFSTGLDLLVEGRRPLQKIGWQLDSLGRVSDMNDETVLSWVLDERDGSASISCATNAPATMDIVLQVSGAIEIVNYSETWHIEPTGNARMKRSLCVCLSNHAWEPANAGDATRDCLGWLSSESHPIPQRNCLHRRSQSDGLHNFMPYARSHVGVAFIAEAADGDSGLLPALVGVADGAVSVAFIAEGADGSRKTCRTIQLSGFVTSSGVISETSFAWM
jgi:hypothetical protein